MTGRGAAQPATTPQDVHKVIVALQPTGHQGSQRDRHLGVILRRRRYDAVDGDPAIGRVDVQLVADPGDPLAHGVALAADIAGPRQAGPPASAEGSSSVAVPDGSAPSPAPLPCGAVPACAVPSSLPSPSAEASPAPRSPSHPARWAPPDSHPSSAQSASYADGSQDGSRRTRKRPAKTSPPSEADRRRSSRKAGGACRQP